MSDFFALMAEVDAARKTSSDMDKYRDYRQVFLGSEQGLRVLASILADCHFFRTPVQSRPVDPYATHIAIGERNAAQRLMKTIMEEPKPKPTQREKQK